VSTTAHKNILFVDYENAGKIDLGALPADAEVHVFIGAAQKSVPTELLEIAHKLEKRFALTKIAGQGKDALDFHIAFYLGEHLTTNAQANCIILSKDKGFDPLVKHLCSRTFNVRRTETISDAFTGTTPSRPAPSRKTPGSARAKVVKKATLPSILAWLQELKARPKKRKGLMAHLRSNFRKVPEPELEQLVDQMIAGKKISEVGGALEYHV
jgi:hypothetical protein